MSKVEDLVKKARLYKQDAIAITDHGKMASVPELITYSRKYDVKPIVGQEFYITPDASIKTREVSNHHIILLALNDNGYKLLCELSSEASLAENFYYYPRIDHEILRKCGKKLNDIVAYTGCLNGEIPELVISGKRKQALNMLNVYRNIFPNLFLEMQRHGGRDDIEFKNRERMVNKFLWQVNKEYDIPFVITNDSHFTDKKQARAHDVLLAIQTGSKIDEENRFRFSGSGYWFKNTKEMSRLFSNDVWKNSNKSLKWIYDNSNIKLAEFTDKKFYIPDVGYKNPSKVIRNICLKNLKKLVKRNKWIKYTKQLDYELSVVKKANYENEFLIVYDYVNWARRNDVVVGGGRGSMVGVLISYLMGITNVDPIRFNLSFERAINPARPSLPDFDVDFSDKNKVIEYVKQKYGEDNVMKIGTFNRMNPRSLLGSIMKTKGYTFQQSIKYTKQLPDTFDIVGAKVSSDLREMLSEVSDDINDLFDKDEEIYQLMFDYNGLVKNMGSHAGGVIIADGTKNLKQYIPGIRVREDTELVSQFDKKDIEKIGFIKFDILGITTLQLIKSTIDYIGHDVFKNFPNDSRLR